MKTSVISDEFRARYLENPADPNAFEGRAIVFDGPEDYHARIDDPALELDEDTVLVIRGVGPIGYPGAAEVVNMRPPDYLLKRGIHELPCIGDGRQSGTSGSPSILNASPEAATGGGLALLQTGDRVRIDLGKRTADILVSDEELAARRDGARAGRRLPVSGEPDAVAGDPARPRRRAVERHGAEAGGQVPAHRRDEGRAPGQPLMGRFRYAYNSFSYYGEEIERSIERVARFGYDAIELVGEPAQYDAARVRELAADAGIAVSSISSMYTAERDLCNPDARACGGRRWTTCAPSRTSPRRRARRRSSSRPSAVMKTDAARAARARSGSGRSRASARAASTPRRWASTSRSSRGTATRRTS